MTRVGSSFSTGKEKSDGADYRELSAWMNLAHFKAERQLLLSRGEVEMFDGQVTAGFIPILCHRANGEVGTLTQRLPKQISEDRVDAYLITMPKKGTITTKQDQRSTIVEPGSFGISYTNMPLRITSSPNSDLAHLSFHILVPSRLVAERLEDPRRICGMSFPLTDEGARIASELTVSLYEHAESMDRRTAESLATAAIDALLNTAQSMQRCEAISEKLGKREKSLRTVLDYMELHCFDPDLAPHKVAHGCGISIRYLHQLLKGANMRFAEHLCNRRLVSAHHQLAESHFSKRTVAEIAYTVGFKNNAHFSRAFRKAFGTTPKSVRSMAEPTVSLSEARYS